MWLHELIDGLPFGLAHGTAAVRVHELCDDSRELEGCGPGWAFLARPGVGGTGRAFVDDAIRRGADVVFAAGRPATAPRHPDGRAVTWVQAAGLDQAMAGVLAERLFGHPARRLRLVGVTGTNGKTSTALIVAHLLRAAGLRCGVIGTVCIDDGQARRPSNLTTPGAIALSRHLARMVHHGCAAAVLEASSHALDQGRTAALAFDAAVFTNLSGDHFDYHATVEDYAAAKAKLFQSLPPTARAVVNADDRHAAFMLAGCPAPALRCAVDPAEDRAHEAAARIRHAAADHSDVRFTGPWGDVSARLPLIGRHNVANALHAIAAAHAVADLGPGLHDALARCPAAPGRLEQVRSPDGTGPLVLVDYAHTHDALRNVLSALRPLTRGRLVVLFGCGGDRDRTKRAKMGAVACQLADRVLVTNDNPRTEAPDVIIGDILAGVPVGAAVHVEADRGRAIELAITQADAGDTVVLAGKGHEPYQIVGGHRHHFDDREQAADALRRRTSV